VSGAILLTHIFLIFKTSGAITANALLLLLEQGITNGEINKIDASTAVLIVLHAVSGIGKLHRSTHKISGEELEENMMTILIDGLKKITKACIHVNTF